MFWRKFMKMEGEKSDAERRTASVATRSSDGCVPGGRGRLFRWHNCVERIAIVANVRQSTPKFRRSIFQSPPKVQNDRNGNTNLRLVHRQFRCKKLNCLPNTKKRTHGEATDHPRCSGSPDINLCTLRWVPTRNWWRKFPSFVWPRRKSVLFSSTRSWSLRFTFIFLTRPFSWQVLTNKEARLLHILFDVPSESIFNLPNATLGSFFTLHRRFSAIHVATSLLVWPRHFGLSLPCLGCLFYLSVILYGNSIFKHIQNRELFLFCASVASCVRFGSKPSSNHITSSIDVFMLVVAHRFPACFWVTFSYLS